MKLDWEVQSQFAPLYLIPETYSTPSYEQTQIIQTAQVLFWMFLLSTLVALATSLAVVKYNKYSPLTTTRTYDEFIRGYLDKHWVIVNLKSGASYAGIFDRGDTSVKTDERDIILREPALYSKEKSNYITTSYQYLYFPGNSISSIAVMYNRSIDKRKTRLNQILFSTNPTPGDDNNE